MLLKKLHLLKMNTFRLVFDKDFFYSGDYVTGHFVIQNSSPMNIKAIILAFKGQAKISIPKSALRNASSSKPKPICILLDKTCPTPQIRLFRCATGCIIEPGEHAYRISYKLPKLIPSSYEGTFGKIQYKATAFVGVGESVAESEITVIKALDALYYESLASPQRACKIKAFNRLSMVSNSRSVFVQLSLPGVISPAGKIYAELNVSNPSGIHLSNITLYLIRTEKFIIPNCAEQLVKIILENVDLGSVDAGAGKSFKQTLVVPNNCDRNLAHCSIIDVNHSVKAVIRPSGLYSKLSLKLPVVVGTLYRNVEPLVSKY
ncbi:Hypothetical predicted protein [Cloeon dipterum]|uniref:Arrestin C-terminal-like domain-containing protein n=1 Tax=Cloeon dipterum TaxID=197152 RepID=A0A8S1DB73_9INSE|nr:Hypothetical predicted protein [Cloeon dipterum]